MYNFVDCIGCSNSLQLIVVLFPIQHNTLYWPFKVTTTHCNVVPIDHIPLSWIHCVLCTVPSLISSSLLYSNVQLVPFRLFLVTTEYSIVSSVMLSSLLSSIVHLVSFLDVSLTSVFFRLLFRLSLMCGV